MSKLYRAILIDPEQSIVTSIEISGLPSEMRELIGAFGLDHFRIADHDASWDYGWCDDQGLTAGKPVYSFKFKIRRDPIAGRCILIGVEKETGKTTDVLFDRRTLADQIEWLGLILPEVTWDRKPGVETAIVTYARVKG